MEHPILFSGPMVRAILDGTKTQTRRAVTPQPPDATTNGTPYTGYQHSTLPGHSRGYDLTAYVDNPRYIGDCPYGAPGDLLWVRETWRAYLKRCEVNTANFRAYDMDPSPETSDIVYKVDVDTSKDFCPWRPSIHMPRWASRITLRVTNVRVQRLQEISYSDAMAEGVCEGSGHGMRSESRRWFSELWDSLNAKRGHSWESNPWVWAVTFERTTP